jgi:hypothetical protein
MTTTVTANAISSPTVTGTSVKADSITNVAGTGSPAILGRTDGIAVAAGMIGESIRQSVASANTLSSTTLNTFADVTNATITLSAGRWQIFGSFGGYGAACSGGTTILRCAISDASNNILDEQYSGVTVSSAIGTVSATVTTPVSIAASTTYKLRIAPTTALGSPTGLSSAVVYGLPSYIYAIRIA